MIPAPKPPEEEERLKELYKYHILDTAEEKIFDTIVHLAATICDVPLSSITLIDRDRQWFKSSIGFAPGLRETDRDPAFCSYTILSNGIFEIKDASTDERFRDNPFVTGEPNIRFYTGVPLISENGYKIGSLCVIDRKPKLLSEQQKVQLQQLSQIVMTLMETRKKMIGELSEREAITSKLETVNTQLETQLNEQQANYSNLSLLSQMNGMLESCHNNQEAYQVVKQFCQNLFPDSSGDIYLLDKNHEYLEVMTSWGKKGVDEQIILPDDCWSLRRGQCYFSGQQHQVKCRHITNPETLSICIPLMAQSQTLGLLTIVFDKLHKKDEDKKSANTEQLLAIAMGEQIAIALANIKLRQTLHEQSIHDPLTGLFNRRYLFQVFGKEMTKILRSKSKMMIVMVDVDHFKQFNDQFGHEAGDIVLKFVASELQACVKKCDLVCRLGGEEFVIIVCNESLEDVCARLEMLRTVIEKKHLEYKGLDLGSITISQGVSLFPENGKSLEELLIAADKALYQAKDTGRNRVVVADKHEEKL